MPPVAHFPKVLAPYAALLFAIALIYCGAFLLAGSSPAPRPLIVFAALAVLGRHRAVVVPGKRASFSPNIMIFLAAVVVFDARGALAGPVLVALAGACFVPALRRGSWGWIVFDGGVYACSTVVAVVVYALTPDPVGYPMPIGILLAFPAAIACIVTMSSLLVVARSLEAGKLPRGAIAQAFRQDVEEFPFAVLGVLVGQLYLTLGPAVVLLTIVPIVIARELFAPYARVRAAHDQTVGMLIRALEAKDRYTAGHAGRVARYASYVGEELRFSAARLERLRFAALMHDIGKLVVPNRLLNKPTRLTPEEFDQIRVHERVSVQMLHHIDFLRPIAGTGHSDNMRFDPDDTTHPIEPYIVMVADAYDAMTSTRAYRKALPQELAFQELRAKAGIQFHPECVEALIRALEARGEKHGAGYEPDTEFVDAPDAGLGSAGLGDLLRSELT